MAAPIDVFISRKSEDAHLADELYRYFISQGLNVFESDNSLPRMGDSDYGKAIDMALNDCKHMVIVGSSYGNISSKWVEWEWRTFINEKMSGRKNGNLLTVVSGDLTINNLPLSLRNYQVIAFNPANFSRIAAYLGKEFREITIDNKVAEKSAVRYSGTERKAATPIVTIPDPVKKKEEAEKNNRTDFGPLGQNRPNGEQDMILQTGHLHFTLHNNGTFTDEASKLMWMQAPWGMVWDGEFFIGEPVRLNWYDATKMFGKGVLVQRREADNPNLGDGVLPPELMEKTVRWNGYTNGSCQVSFAGYSDWRLPTCDDFYRTILRHIFSGIKEEDREKEKEILKKVFGDWDAANRFWNYFFWTANGRIYKDFFEKWGLDNKVAWKAAPATGIITDERKESNCIVLFTRNI